MNIVPAQLRSTHSCLATQVDCIAKACTALSKILWHMFSVKNNYITYYSYAALAKFTN